MCSPEIYHYPLFGHRTQRAKEGQPFRRELDHHQKALGDIHQRLQVQFIHRTARDFVEAAIYREDRFNQYLLTAESIHALHTYGKCNMWLLDAAVKQDFPLKWLLEDAIAQFRYFKAGNRELVILTNAVKVAQEMDDLLLSMSTPEETRFRYADYEIALDALGIAASIDKFGHVVNGLLQSNDFDQSYVIYILMSTLVAERHDDTHRIVQECLKQRVDPHSTHPVEPPHHHRKANRISVWQAWLLAQLDWEMGTCLVMQSRYGKYRLDLNQSHAVIRVPIPMLLMEWLEVFHNSAPRFKVMIREFAGKNASLEFVCTSHGFWVKPSPESRGELFDLFFAAVQASNRRLEFGSYKEDKARDILAVAKLKHALNSVCSNSKLVISSLPVEEVRPADWDLDSTHQLLYLPGERDAADQTVIGNLGIPKQLLQGFGCEPWEKAYDDFVTPFESEHTPIFEEAKEAGTFDRPMFAEPKAVVEEERLKDWDEDDPMLEDEEEEDLDIFC